jgi:hypothetical protein
MASSSPLALDDYRRYGRQMILDEIGLEGVRGAWLGYASGL